MSQEKEKEPFTKVTLLGSSWLNYNDWAFFKTFLYKLSSSYFSRNIVVLTYPISQHLPVQEEQCYNL